MDDNKNFDQRGADCRAFVLSSLLFFSHIPWRRWMRLAFLFKRLTSSKRNQSSQMHSSNSSSRILSLSKSLDCHGPTCRKRHLLLHDKVLLRAKLHQRATVKSLQQIWRTKMQLRVTWYRDPHRHRNQETPQLSNNKNTAKRTFYGKIYPSRRYGHRLSRSILWTRWRWKSSSSSLPQHPAGGDGDGAATMKWKKAKAKPSKSTGSC